MIKIHWLSIIITICFVSCKGGDSYKIEGKLTNLEDPTIYAVFEGRETKFVDTVQCEKPGQFFIKQKGADYDEATIFFDNKTKWVTVYLEKGKKIKISGDVNYPSILKIEGGKINDKLAEEKKRLKKVLKEQTDLMDQLNEKNDSSSIIEETDLASRLSNLQHQLLEEVASFIKTNPTDETSVVLLNKYFSNPDDTRRLDELMAVLSPDLKEFYLYKELKAFSENAQRTMLGAEAPDFNVTNIYGKSVSLDSLQRKYRLLVFTAPWCDMCQTENLYLDEIYHKYPQDSLSMLLVSLDDNMPEVKKLIEKDKIKWNLVTDSAAQATQLIGLYNVRDLPLCYLIDEKGKIILKTDNGLELKQTIEKLFE